MFRTFSDEISHVLMLKRHSLYIFLLVLSDVNMNNILSDDEYEDALSSTIHEQRIISNIINGVANQAALDTDLSKVPIIQLLIKQCKDSNRRLNLIEQYSRKNSTVLNGNLGISSKLKGSRFSQQVVEVLNKVLFPHDGEKCFTNINK